MIDNIPEYDGDEFSVLYIQGLNNTKNWKMLFYFEKDKSFFVDNRIPNELCMTDGYEYSRNVIYKCRVSRTSQNFPYQYISIKENKIEEVEEEVIESLKIL